MKVLISDLDGTLYPRKIDENSKQLQNNIAAIKKWINYGNIFVVATARGKHHYDTITKQLGFKPNFIGSNGAEVIYESGEEKIKQIPMKIYIDLCKFITLERINASVATGFNDEWIWSSKDCYPIKDATTYLPSWDYIKVISFEDLNPLDKIERIQIFITPKERDVLKDRIKSLNFDIEVTVSDDDLIDIGPKNSSKAISILEMCEKYKLSQSDLISIGDSENDISMFKISGISYCIDHSDKIVKDAATKIVKSVEEAINIELEKLESK